MKYAVLAYTDADWDDRPQAEKRRVHGRGVYGTLHSDSAQVLAHYRVAPSRPVVALELAGEDLVRSAPLRSDDRPHLRALFLVESDDADAVVELARRLPVLGLGGTVEIWPVAQPSLSRSASGKRRLIGRRRSA